MRMGMESDDEINAESVEGGWRLRRGRVCLDQSSSVWLMMMMRLGWRSRSESELELESVDDGGDVMREGERRGEREEGES
jgi:hypothetical protein